MGAVRSCLTLTIFTGAIGYIMVAIYLPQGIYRAMTYDPLMMGYIDARPPNRYLREPWKLTRHLCDETECMKEKDVNWTMVTFIKSKIDYYKRREFIRRTWGAINYLNGAKFENVFIIGKSKDPYVKMLLDEEEARYGDLLQFDGPDSYQNMPFKVLAGMEWASRHLTDDMYYASADDDFLIYQNLFAKNMTAIRNEYQNNQTSFPILCLFKRGVNENAVRIRASKWYVTYNEYKRSLYPVYCHGGMYAMSMPVVTQLWNESRTAPMLRLDDVWITGILRKRMNFSDELLYSLPHVTRHFGTVSDLIKTRMDKEWTKIKTSLENETTCTCTL